MYKQRGLSLIELMISLTLGLVLMTGVVQMFLSSRVTYSTQQAISRIQESGRMAVDFLSHDMRMAGYMGCSSQKTDIEYGLDGQPDYRYEFGEAIRGYSAEDAPALIDAADDTEVLAVRRAVGGGVPIVDEHDGPSNANLNVIAEPDSNCLLDGQLCPDQVAIITDCTQSYIFRAVSISNSNPATIAHSQGGGNDGPKNKDSQLGGRSFGEGSQIMALNTITYYIAESEFSPDGSGDTEMFSLWRQTGEGDNGDPVELLEGVEDMRIQYGVTNGGGSGPPDTYKSLSEMSNADWENVKAARLHLMLQSTHENIVPDAQTLDFAGEERTFNDGRMRHVFTTTVGIRGRLN